ncbi:MAG: hypothetical protein AB8B86_03910 [Pseudomonadales bacterium]
MTKHNSNQSTELSKTLHRALNEAKVEESPPHIDQQIIAFARQNTPAKSRPIYNWWMPAATACCLAGIAVLIALPMAPALDPTFELSDVVSDSDVTSRESFEPVLSPAQAKADPYSNVGADEGDSRNLRGRRQEIVASDAAPESSLTSMAVALPPQTELTQSASTRAISQNRRESRSEAYSEPESEFAETQTIRAASPGKGIHAQENHGYSESEQLSVRLELPQKHYQRLLIISSAAPPLDKSSTSPSSDALLGADTNAREGLADTALALSNIREKMAVKKQAQESNAKNVTEQELEKEDSYRTLREQCDCQLPESLDDAVRMLIDGDIVASAKQP